MGEKDKCDTRRRSIIIVGGEVDERIGCVATTQNLSYV